MLVNNAGKRGEGELERLPRENVLGELGCGEGGGRTPESGELQERDHVVMILLRTA